MEDSLDGCGSSGAATVGTLGSPRPHSASLVKILTASAAPITDVITSRPIADVITPITDVITSRPITDVITSRDDIASSPLGDVISEPLVDVIDVPASVSIHDAGVALTSDQPVFVKDGIVSSTSSRGAAQEAATHVMVPDTKDSTSTLKLEPDWQEAAQAAVLTVCCKKTVAELVKNKFGSGSRGKCIFLGKQWFTPTEFEAHCGRSASKDWKRSIRFQGQSLLSLIEGGFLRVHAASCSCGACLDDEAAAGAVRLHHPIKRKKRERYSLDSEKVLKPGIADDCSTDAPTVSLPVSGLGELTVVPAGSIVLGARTPATPATLTTAAPPPQPSTPALPTPDASPSSGAFAGLPLDKAWDQMNEVMLGLERSVSQARVLLEDLRERTKQESDQLRHKLLQEKEEAVTQAKLEAQLSTMSKSSEGFLVQVHENDGSQSLQPIMLDSFISSVPSLSPAPSINGVQKKCVNCNRESELECSGCHNRAYCSDFCQRRDWTNHQSECGRCSPAPEDPLNPVSHTPGYIFMLSDMNTS